MSMGNRDFEYIDTRLLSPSGNAMDAHIRLKRIGEHELAAELMDAMVIFQDACRKVRRQVEDIWRTA